MNGSVQGYNRVHFVGIGGIGMSALARLLHAHGVEVTGSDRDPGEQGRLLAETGVRVITGHAPENVEGAQLVVHTSAVDATNPEIRRARELGLVVVKRAELLATVMNDTRGIAIAGTHGKTTTSALLGWILAANNLSPTILVGGVMSNIGSNALVGRGDLVVAEADEYDGSFLRLRPAIGVLTNAEPEHLDFYGTADAMYAAFGTFLAAAHELVVACADDPHVRAMADGARVATITYGLEAGDVRGRDIEERDGTLYFVADLHGAPVDFVTQLAGRHNVQNALAAIVVADYLGVPMSGIQRAVAAFSGVERRLQVVGAARDITVVDDYAHHPTEIAAVLAALAQRYRRPIRVIFQPHTYSRTASLLTDFPPAFDLAGQVIVLDIYAARETDTLGMSGELLAERIASRRGNVVYAATPELAVQNVVAQAQSGDVIVTMGAGDVTRLAPRVTEAVRRQ